MTAFPKYERYKDSGVEWLGEVPEHWEVDALRACAELSTERNRPDLPVLSVYREYGVIPKDSRDDNHNATSLDTSNYKVVRPGDLAVNKMKAWQGSLGVSEHHGIVSPAYITCRVNQEKVNGRYLHYLLRSKPLIGALDSLSYGVRVGQWDMRFEDFKQIRLTYPPKPEQDRIVAFLDRKTAEIDALIAKKQRQIELLDEQKAILINRSVTRGLNPNAKLKPSGIEWIGEIPEHWEALQLKRVAKVQGGYAFPAQAFGDIGLPVVRMNNLKRGTLDLSEVARVPERLDHPRYRLNEGDLCYGLSGSVGATGSLGNYAFVGSHDLPCLLNQRVALFVPDKTRVTARFLALVIQTPSFYSQILLKTTGTAQFNVSTGDVEGAVIQLPPLSEQDSIIEAITTIETATARVCKSVGDQIQSLQTLRSTLIAHAVTGRIKV